MQTEATRPRLSPTKSTNEVRCPRCHRLIDVEVVSTPRVEHRRGQDVVKFRHTAPAICECAGCWTKFRLHLLETPSGQVQLVAGVKLA